MKLVFLCFYFLVAVAICRLFTSRGKTQKKFWQHVQSCIHCCPCGIAVCFQWYVLLFTGLTIVTVWTYFNNVRVLIFQGQWMTPKIPAWLRQLSKAGLVAGAVTFLLLMAHFFTDVKAGRRWRIDHNQRFQWAASKRQDMVLWVIAMPGIFTAMSVQSTARMFMVITGKDSIYGEEVDKALYTENLDLAAATQFYVVFVFSRLCWQFIKERSTPETQSIVKWAGFQGVNAWVLLGVFRAVFDFCFRYANAHHKEYEDLIPEDVWNHTYVPELQKVSHKFEDYFTVLTILCVYNMFLICNFEKVKDALGNANGKFTGIRILIILGQLQPQVVQMPIVQHFSGLNEDTGKLLHSTLLTFECLLVVLFNYQSWELGKEVKKELLYDARNLVEREKDAANNVNAPLLGNAKEDDNARGP